MSESSLSLYFGLQKGRNADLEVVSRAAIEWANSVRLATKMIEPNAEIRIEFINAHEGSLSLNTILDWGEGKLDRVADIQHPKLARIAVGLAIFLLIDAGPATDYWFGAPDQIELSDHDRKLLDDLLEKISKSEELKTTSQKFFTVVGNDPAVSSVGVCAKPSDKPAFSVPSSQFAERSGLWEQNSKPNERTSERISDVILEGADLSESDRVWRFLDIETGISFTAKMRDEKFVETLRGEGISENLRTGIKMRILIKFKERLVDGSWKSVPSTIEVVNVTLS